jgi:integrase
MRLTKRTVDAEAPSAGERFVWDSELPGFGLRVFPTGRKTYVIQYRNGTGRTRRLTLGKHGVLTPQEARSLARERLLEVAQGQDPSAERKSFKAALTVAELADRYLTEHAEVKKKPSSVRLDRRLLSQCILPKLGRLTVAEVESSDVARMHHAFRETPVQANRSVGVLSKMMNLAEMWGLRSRGTNPCLGIEKFKEQPRERFLSTEELSRLGAVLATAEREGSEHPSVLLALRLLLLTGARKSEILELRWKEVDFERACLRLEDSKTGAKTIPLGAPALKLLTEVERQKDNPYVCWGKNPGGHFVGLQKSWERLRNQAQLPGLRLHDLRHSFASLGAAGGLSMPLLGALLGHTQASTTKRYLHFREDPLVEAANEVAGRISAALHAAAD